MCTEPEDSERTNDESTTGGSAGDGPDDLLHEGVGRRQVFSFSHYDLTACVECNEPYGFYAFIESPGFVWCYGTSKLECIDQLIIMLAKRIEDFKAVKDRLEREFMVEFERSKK